MLGVLYVMVWGIKICVEAAEMTDWKSSGAVAAYGILLALIITMEGFCLLALAMFWSIW